MNTNLQFIIHTIGKAARQAARTLASCSTDQKNKALLLMADQIKTDQKEILDANLIDVTAAMKGGLNSSMVDRLKLSPESLDEVAEGIRHVARLPDPVGRILREWKRSNKLSFQKVSVPLGVIGMIYESRPNVTVDAAILCLKAGNACILRGGSEACHSNKALALSLQRALEASELPSTSIQLIPVTDREAIRILCEMDQYLDCLIPRGGKGLIKTIVEHARMPVMKHYEGICTAYVDKEANLTMAEQIILNAKCQRPSACNALETVLLHQKIALEFLKTAGEKLLQQGAELRCDPKTLALLPKELQKNFTLQIKKATKEDFQTEFLSLIVAIKIVDSLEEAIDHIENHGSHHSDLIITEDANNAEKFLRDIDSATVYWNASTRFTDGSEFGFGAEIGISTDKFHARGPVGLEELTSYKYLIRGNGQVRR
ncbi:MAG: glutamate-5-semialdehyde dehydrogenase [Verrucomicrobia bacterium RIFCSPHIGHO2_12_FULL_41_10]|nr:MAG: glutamate-5-semialdehyde dehydrogenase [Verrucomicrobia bacterium RIFCSPHIGHO2_12_FULL_41_10]